MTKKSEVVNMTLYKTESTEEVKVTPEELEKVHQQVFAFRQKILSQARRPYQNPNPKIVIVYCMMFYGERVAQVKKCVKRVAPYVQRCVLVHDGTVEASDIEELYQLSQKKAEFVYRKWEDHFSKHRNAYLEHVNEGEWVLVSDPDELFSRLLLKDIRAILTDAEKQGINILAINSRDITTELDGTVTKTVSQWYKQLLFKMEEGVRYVNKIHETLLPGLRGWRIENLNPQYYYYVHLKDMLEVKERGARNVFIGGGGLCVLDKNPMYQEWHAWTTLHLAELGNVADWNHMRAYIRKGNIHPDLKQIFINHRNDNGWDYENESRDPFIWYKALFSDEIKEWESTPGPPSKGSPPEVMTYVEEQYLKILGRPADIMGKEHYTGAIISGILEREKLPEVLMASDEYREKKRE